MIRLMQSTFFNEEETKEKLCNFIRSAEKLSMDTQCLSFEQAFAKFQGCAHSLFVNSGSSANLALIQALLNLGWLKPGDKVGFSALTWATNVMPLLQLGLVPVPVDVSLSCLNVMSEQLLHTIDTHQIRAFFITNLLGFCGDLDLIADLCKERGVILLEDNCESLGSEYKQKKLGNYGLASTFSFFVGHHMSTIEGGMVCTNNTELSHALSMVRAHGWGRNLPDAVHNSLQKKYGIDSFYSKYTFYVPGYNLRPTEINAFIGLEQLKYLHSIIQTRAHNFALFSKASQNNPNILPLDVTHMNVVSNFAYPVVCKDTAMFQKYLHAFTAAGVEIRPIVGGSMVEQPFMSTFSFDACPNAQMIHRQGFYFPNHAELDSSQLLQLCTLVGNTL